MITGLPRSGSSLLTAILKQNPRFHSSISDGLAASIVKGLEACQSSAGMRAEMPDARKRDFVNGMFDGFYKCVDKEIVFNTNRGWTYLTPLINDLYPNSKMRVCVRDIKWILDSFELAFRRNPYTVNTVSHGGLSGNVYSRSDSLMAGDSTIGFAYNGLKQAITGAEKKNLMIVEYDQLCKNPKGMIMAIYNFIGEPQFEHDFNNVQMSWDEYDAEIGIKLHDVRKKVEFKTRETILPPDLIHKYSGMEVWR
jgi:sulfotransferase